MAQNWLWLLTKISDCKIKFYDMTLVEIDENEVQFCVLVLSVQSCIPTLHICLSFYSLPRLG